MDVQRVPKANPEMDELEARLKRELAELDREFRERARPIMDQLVKIEQMREYSWFVTPAPSPRAQKEE